MKAISDFSSYILLLCFKYFRCIGSHTEMRILGRVSQLQADWLNVKYSDVPELLTILCFKLFKFGAETISCGIQFQ